MAGDFRVWKYVLPAGGFCFIDLPASAKILHVGAQGDDLCFWALVDPEAEPERRKFQVAATGLSKIIFNGYGGLKHRGTALMRGGALVWHLFEHGSTGMYGAINDGCMVWSNDATLEMK